MPVNRQQSSSSHWSTYGDVENTGAKREISMYNIMLNLLVIN